MNIIRVNIIRVSSNNDSLFSIGNLATTMAAPAYYAGRRDNKRVGKNRACMETDSDRVMVNADYHLQFQDARISPFVKLKKGQYYHDKGSPPLPFPPNSAAAWDLKAIHIWSHATKQFLMSANRQPCV